MSFLDTIRSARTTDPSRIRRDSNRGIFGFQTPKAGVPVDEDVALTYSTVWACVRLIAETIASTPWHVFAERPGGVLRRSRGPIETALDQAPNEEMDAQSWREAMGGHMLTWGNGYNEIERSRNRQAVAFHPITPERMNPTRTRGGRLVYEVSNEGQSNRTFDPKDILHFHGLGYDGVVGYSPVAKARESISMGLSMDRSAAGFFGNGANPTTVITRPSDKPPLSAKARQEFREEWMRMHGGPENFGGPAFLQEGMGLERLTIPPNEAQFLESRRFSAQEIASRWYRVPLIFVGLLENATIGNAEQEAIMFVRYTLRFWARKMEMEVKRKLLGPERVAKINFSELLRGDSKTRTQVRRLQYDRGVVSINEWREDEGMNPVEGGELRMVPGNMVPLERAGEQMRRSPGGEPPSADTERAKEAQAGVISYEIERMVSREGVAAKKAAKKHAGDPVGFDGWMEKFYADQERKLIEALTPVGRALGKLTGAEYERQIAEHAAEHCRRSREQLSEAFLDGNLEQVCDEWLKERPAEAAIELTEAIAGSREEAAAA